MAALPSDQLGFAVGKSGISRVSMKINVPDRILNSIDPV